jgi:hypothetical protein
MTLDRIYWGSVWDDESNAGSKHETKETQDMPPLRSGDNKIYIIQVMSTYNTAYLMSTGQCVNRKMKSRWTDCPICLGNVRVLGA